MVQKTGTPAPAARAEDPKEKGKRLAGEAACENVRSGMVVGLGTGSTVKYTILNLGRMCREGLDIVGVPTSVASEKLAREVGIPLSTLDEHPALSVAIDGADEIDPELDLIKGGGGALTREKVVAQAADKFVVVVDESKLVSKLGVLFPLPVEVVPFAKQSVRQHIEGMGAKAALREKEGKPFVTDNGNIILDCKWPTGIAEKKTVERDLNLLAGVVENGLFVRLTDQVYVGKADGTVQQLKRGPGRVQ